MERYLKQLITLKQNVNTSHFAGNPYSQTMKKIHKMFIENYTKANPKNLENIVSVKKVCLSAELKKIRNTFRKAVEWPESVGFNIL